MVLCLQANAQTGNSGTGPIRTVVEGRVSDERGEPLLGANIYFEGTYEGCSSDARGDFRMATGLEGEQALVVRFLGSETWQQALRLSGDTVRVEVVLEESRHDLGEVVIAVGRFAAGDEEKSAVMNRLDMSTSGSGGFGDMADAISSPARHQCDGRGRRANGPGRGAVRNGGDHRRHACRRCLYGKDAQRAGTGRFSPMLFRGTVFSTGGYSAEYGQALSSVLILNSIGIP
ncbi:MAG: carboxypeptidase-like regulatory domain-containing protein [Bacteroidales bacterium]